MIDMRNKISRLQFSQCPNGQGLIFIISLLYLVFMIALEDLVISIANKFNILVDKSFVNGSDDGVKNYFSFPTGSCREVIENALESFKLAGIFCKQKNAELFRFPAFQIPDQQIKLAIEG